MSSFLQDHEASLCLDGGVRGSIPGVKALTEQPPTLESVQRKRRFILLPGNIRNCSQRSLDQGREQDTTSDVLH